jgi:hypothetical protein
MRRPALIVFAVAALSLRGLASGPLVSLASRASDGADRIEAVGAAAPVLTSVAQFVRGAPVAGVTPSLMATWALTLCALLASIALTRPLARSHARSQPSRAPPRLLV